MTFLTQASMLTPLQRLQRAHVEMMGNPHTMAYSGVLMVGKYEVQVEVRTAKTNGIDCVYGEKFIGEQDDASLRGLILHENLHKCFQHMFLWQHLYADDPKIANMACDYVINLIIYDIDCESGGFIRLPDGGLLDERFRNMSAQDVFDILKQEQEGESDGDGDDGEGESGEGQEGGNSYQGGSESLDDHDWESGGSMSQEEVEQAKKEIDQAIRQGQLMAGKLGGNESRVLNGLTDPKVDWREQLREFVSSSVVDKDMSTWQRVNRRWLQHDVYMPATISETMGRMVVAVDTSGSINGSILTKFLSEVQAIAVAVKPEKLDLIYWDAEVARHEVYAQQDLDKMVGSTKPAGGGGTDVTCVSKYLKDNQIRPECVVVLTDGDLYNGWSAWEAPVLWCITGNKNAKPTCGVAIYMD